VGFFINKDCTFDSLKADLSYRHAFSVEESPDTKE